MHSLLERPVTQEPLRLVPQRPLDLRRRRDLLSRRIGSEIRRRLLRGVVLAVGDSFAVIAGLVLSYGFASTIGVPSEELWNAHLFEMLAVTLLGQAASGTYGPIRQEHAYERVLIGLAVSFGALALIGLGDGRIQMDLSLSLFFATFLSAFLLAERWLLARVVLFLYRHGIGTRNTLIIGPAREVGDLKERFMLTHDDVRVIGHVCPVGSLDSTALGDVDQLHQVLEDFDIRNVVVSSQLSPRSFKQLIEKCLAHGAAVSIVPAILNDIAARVSSHNLLGWPLLELDVPRLHLVQLTLKRTVDILGSLLGILVSFPVYLLVAFAVRLESTGPVLFRQKRLGVGGRKFTIYKFRTMHTDAERELEKDPVLYARYVANNYKLPPGEDPRVSNLGRFLRRTSLDELPQLFNVLRGDMSLVGPRPIVPSEIREYGEKAGVFLGVKPGLTGYWQVSGRSHVGYPERADLDIYYINRWSLALDLKILFLTIPRLLNGAH